MDFVMYFFAGNKASFSLATGAKEILKAVQMYHAKWTTGHCAPASSCIVQRAVSSLRGSKLSSLPLGCAGLIHL
jgi:hypothetical protein